MSSKNPVFNVCKAEEVGKKNGDKATYWYHVGVAFPHENGSGFNVKLAEGISVTGSLVIMAPKEKSTN